MIHARKGIRSTASQASGKRDRARTDQAHVPHRPITTEGPGTETDLDARFQAWTVEGNRAVEAGDNTGARRAYKKALDEAGRLFDLAHSSQTAEVALAAAMLAPMVHTIACINASELEQRGKCHGQALAFAMLAVSRLVAAAERPDTPFMLRVHSVRHTRFALTALADHLVTHPLEVGNISDRRSVAALLARARAATQGVLKTALVLAKDEPEPGPWAELVDVRLASSLLARANPGFALMLRTVDGLIGAGYQEDMAQRPPTIGTKWN